jgi:signal transduction histidine kinase
VIDASHALFTRKEVTLEPLDLNEATREVIALSLSDLHRNRVVLRLELADELPTITGDRIQLQQVILNLLRNASEAMTGVDDRPRHLLVKTEREPGWRAHDSTGCRCRPRFVERHHGRLWAEPNDGAGATFSFSIPLAPEGSTNAAPESHTY